MGFGYTEVAEGQSYALVAQADMLVTLLDRVFIPERVTPSSRRRAPAILDRTLASSRGVRQVPGAKLFFPEEDPDLIAEEARRLWSGA